MKIYEKLAADYIEACRKLEEAQRRVSVMQEAMAQFAEQEQVKIKGHSISVREREILSFVVQLKSNKEIANALNITERTVKFHVSNLLAKHGFKKRAQLIFLVSQQVSPQSGEADTQHPSHSRCRTSFHR